MTPGARLQAAIELIDEILPQDPAAIPPADKSIQSYVRARRFMGSKDRAWVNETVYGILRAKARIDWHLACSDTAPTARLRVFAHILLAQGWSLAAIGEACATGAYSATLPSPEELSALRYSIPVESDGSDICVPRTDAREPRLDDDAQPDWVRGEYPEWLEVALLDAFGGQEALMAEMTAATRPSTITLRVNRLKTDRAEAMASLTADGISPSAHHLLLDALDVPVRSPVETTRTWRSGWIEVQDAAAQIAARLVDARPGMTVCDYCAGAGGKTLALAADMGGSGRIVACDIHAGRLKPLAKRAERAGCAGMIDGRVLGRDADPEADSFDRVLVDAPCSGSGTWRRNPEAKWRLTPREVTALTDTQDRILDRAAALVRRGGRLVYATCSILPIENAQRVAAFLARHPAFAQLDAREKWRECQKTDPPFDDAAMFLTPARNGTDGFFTAILERVR